MNRNIDILNELNEISLLLAGVGNGNVFTVPPGYFDTLAGTVMVSVISGSNAMQAPEGYFEGLSTAILSKIEGTAANELQALSPLLAGLKRDNPFSIPGNYFEQLPAEVLLKTDETLSAVLSAAKQVQPFTVPQGYFDSLGDNVLHRIKEQSGAKVIAMPKHRNNIFKYAAAAVFTGIVALGVYQFTNNSGNTVTAALSPAVEQGKLLASDDQKFDEALNGLAEEDIAQYLEKNGSVSDIAMLASGLDENDLPNQDDYLIDDNTLDNFIEATSLKN